MALRRAADQSTALDLAQRIVDVASDRQAQDVVLLDISQIASFADYFVICSGTSERQLKAIVDNVTETLEREGFHAVHTEGAPSSGWVLIDYGSVIVHVFAPEERDYYRLERLWGEAPTIVRVQ
ncbi:MAG TPA: ribosome silencing factor [Chloroflexota bacterium]|jgi:ribosome-associated protein|nr:ribosome silencing factor [Chloroflexota bacterium]